MITAAPAAHAKLPDPKFGPGTDPAATYVRQTTCSPTEKPGVLAFRRVIMKAFPQTSEGYIVRACSAGGTSEHKEGRAWDWGVSAASARDRKIVDKVLDWLLKKDEYGNKYGLVRRFGIMYMIWNHRIWTPWYGWHAYTGSSPHTDHVHFSFTWPGARKQTTWYHPLRSFVTATSSDKTAPGFWGATGNARVVTAGAAPFEGDKHNTVTQGMIAGMASTPTGEGYWLVRRGGRLLAYGNAKDRGTITGSAQVSDMSVSPHGIGYWILTKSGRVWAFGRANRHGSLQGNGPATGITSTPGGGGYWILTHSGSVSAFGNAQEFDPVPELTARFVDIASSPDQGYWIVTKAGRVFARGAATSFGDLSQVDLAWPIVGIAPTPTGLGYWLINSKGRSYAFGDAAKLGEARAVTTPARPPTTSVVPEATEGPSLFERISRR